MKENGMSRRGRDGKAAWAARAATYQQELTDQITREAKASMDAWAARGRVPPRVRLASRLAGRPVRLPAETRE
jgi:hypothetical protein